jgi:hypothetical protein
MYSVLVGNLKERSHLERYRLRREYSIDIDLKKIERGCVD